MSEDVQISTLPEGVEAPPQYAPPRRRRRGWLRRRTYGRPPKPRLRKLRFLAVLLGLVVLALISTVFGMMMAVASDIPLIEKSEQYADTQHNSILEDYQGHPIGILAAPTNQVVDTFGEISPYMRRAVVAVEDQRFWSEPGVDIRGIARAFLADLTGSSRQGASTITEQFVKNALQEQNNRTVFEKLREAALAYHLSRRWPKQKILTEYLNSVYFGNGAYGVESAARVYFGNQLGYDSQASAGQTVFQSGSVPKCGDGTIKAMDANGNEVSRPLPKCASLLAPWQAALLAGMISNPSGYDPIANPNDSKLRRNLVLRDMLTRGPVRLSRKDFLFARAQPLPNERDLQQPTEPTAAPYFTSWLRPQIVTAICHAFYGVLACRQPRTAAGQAAWQQRIKLSEYRAYFGGLTIKTTLDLQLQHAADQAVAQYLPYQGPTSPVASLVAIDNRTGQVRAMVGGPVDPSTGQEMYSKFPFNLATQGERQPGSAFKPFTLAVALKAGFGPSTLLESSPWNYRFIDYKGLTETFKIRNFANAYSGVISLAGATAYSDNSAYARLGLLDLKDHGGLRRIKKMAQDMGIRTPISTNPAMILGGLTIGVTPLDMAHAYETFATGGLKVFDPTLGAPHQGPTGIAAIQCPAKICPNADAQTMRDDNLRRTLRILPPEVAATAKQLLLGPVQYGTATKAQIPGVVVAGKTGTTSNYGDAWFVGWTPQLTVAVWVGVADKLVSMATDYQGGPVEGGTYPALIWQNFMVQALQVLATEAAQNPSSSSSSSSQTNTGAQTTSTPSSGSGTATTDSGSGSGTSSNTSPSTSSNSNTNTSTSGTGTTPGGNGSGNGTGGGSLGGSGGTGLPSG